MKVRDHSFADQDGGHAIPYGVYDVAANTGFVNVGTDHNTAALAVESIRRWWDLAGRDVYPGAGRLLVCCDAGGSNGWRNRAWKAGLAQFAQDSGLEIRACQIFCVSRGSRCPFVILLWIVSGVRVRRGRGRGT